MYTLKDVIKKKLRICCPEEWQRNSIVDYFINQFKDEDWNLVDYHKYGEYTYFTIKESQFKCGIYYAQYGDKEDEKGNYILYEEFAEICGNQDINGFEEFLMGD